MVTFYDRRVHSKYSVNSVKYNASLGNVNKTLLKFIFSHYGWDMLL